MRQLSENTIVRDVAAADAPQLLTMIQALARFHEDTPQITEEALHRDVFGASPWIHVLVAEANERLLGYAALCPLMQLQNGKRGLDLHHLFVEAEARGAGIGRALITASIEKACMLSCAYVSVSTDADNSKAANVYLTCGFEERHSQGRRFRLDLGL